MAIRVLTKNPVPKDLLVKFKQYANIADSSRDAVLIAILNDAIDRVHRVCDIPVLPETLERVADGRRRREVSLYRWNTGARVESVTTLDGAPLAYERTAQGIRTETLEAVKVVYTTCPEPVGEMTVLQYALGVEEGRTPSELCDILNAQMRNL